jgi:division protein CdvB (Snf7/Vps24/ESCRT-III family)
MDERNDILAQLRRMAQLNPDMAIYARAANEIEQLRQRIEELETGNSVLDIAVEHWRHNYKHLEDLYSQLAGRG